MSSNYVLKCSACGVEVPIEPIVARMMQNNKSKQSFCMSCKASDTVTLVEKEPEGCVTVFAVLGDEDDRPIEEVKAEIKAIVDEASKDRR